MSDSKGLTFGVRVMALLPVAIPVLVLVTAGARRLKIWSILPLVFLILGYASAAWAQLPIPGSTPSSAPPPRTDPISEFLNRSALPVGSSSAASDFLDRLRSLANDTRRPGNADAGLFGSLPGSSAFPGSGVLPGGAGPSLTATWPVQPADLTQPALTGQSNPVETLQDINQMPASKNFFPADIREMLAPSFSEDGMPQSLAPIGLEGATERPFSSSFVPKMENTLHTDLKRYRWALSRGQPQLAAGIASRWRAFFTAFPHYRALLVDSPAAVAMAVFFRDLSASGKNQTKPKDPPDNSSGW